jgi:hypothetical protein
MRIAARPSARPTPSAPAPSSPAPEPAPDDGAEDVFKKVAGHVVGAALGFGAGAAGLVVNACAGGAEGALHAARAKDGKDLAFHGLFALNLAASGGISGPAGAVWGLVKGALIWQMEGDAVRENVRKSADKWVDRALDRLPGGNPDDPTPLRRIGNGIVGEVVGGVAGGLSGATDLFAAGNAYGHGLVDKLAEALRADPQP